MKKITLVVVLIMFCGMGFCGEVHSSFLAHFDTDREIDFQVEVNAVALYAGYKEGRNDCDFLRLERDSLGASLTSDKFKKEVSEKFTAEEGDLFLCFQDLDGETIGTTIVAFLYKPHFAMSEWKWYYYMFTSKKATE